MRGMSATPKPAIRVELADRSHGTAKKPGKDPKRRVKFGVPICDTLKNNQLPPALVEILVYIAQEGVTTTDLFRRPGNTNELKVIIGRLTEGKEVNLNNYNFYTLASVIKKFLLKIPGGILGPETEKKMLKVVEKNQRMEQYDFLHGLIARLPTATQQLLALLFGTWFRIVNHSEFNTMSSEAVAKSVAGSLFHTCADDPKKIDQAVAVLQILIDDFGVAILFGHKNIQYFADMTRTGIRVREKFRYEVRYPAGESTGSDSQLELFALKIQQDAAARGLSIEQNAITEDEFYGRPRSRQKSCDSTGLGIHVNPAHPPSPQSLQAHHRPEDYNPHKKLSHTGSFSTPNVNKEYSPTQELSPAKPLSTSLNRFDNVKRRQMIRMKKRSNWFLSPSACSPQGSPLSREPSPSTAGGKSSSLEPASSDDGLLSDTALSDASPLSARKHHNQPRNLDSSFVFPTVSVQSKTESPNHSRTPPLHKRRDIVNGNHHPENSPSHTRGATSSPSPVGAIGGKSSLAPPWDSSSPSRSPSPQVPPACVTPVTSHSTMTSSKHSSPSRDVPSEGQVRYFMMETFYGSAANENQTPTHS